MLQESASSKGPGVPTSIHSTKDSIKTWTSTLMRIDHHHESQEFSDLDLGSQISQIPDGRSSDDWSAMAMIHLKYRNDMEWYCRAMYRAGAQGYGMAWSILHYPSRPCPTRPPWVHPCTSGTRTYDEGCGAAEKRVLWAQIWTCVTLKTGLKSF